MKSRKRKLIWNRKAEKGRRGDVKECNRGTGYSRGNYFILWLLHYVHSLVSLLSTRVICIVQVTTDNFFFVIYIFVIFAAVLCRKTLNNYTSNAYSDWILNYTVLNIMLEIDYCFLLCIYYLILICLLFLALKT